MSERDTIDPIHTQEQRFAFDTLTSATTLRACHEVLMIPENVSGMTIIDVGAGASPLTADLLIKGANAYAVDWLYQDPELLAVKLQESFPKILDQTPPSHKLHMQMATMEAIQQFNFSFQANRDRYLPGWFTDLPFDDNFADMVVSLNGISHMGQPDILEKSIEEALRVLKPEGTFMMAPYHTNKGRHTLYRDQHRKALNSLSKKNIGEIEIKGIKGLYQDCKLVITKK